MSTGIDLERAFIANDEATRKLTKRAGENPVNSWNLDGTYRGEEMGSTAAAARKTSRFACLKLRGGSDNSETTEEAPFSFKRWFKFHFFNGYDCVNGMDIEGGGAVRKTAEAFSRTVEAF